jgi:glycolate oxidase FAD binding subunit
MADFDASEALLDQVRQALENATPLRIQGGNTKAFLGREVAGEVLDTRAHCGIVSYDPTELVISVRAGTPLSELFAALDAAGQMLPCEPPSFGEGATVGGMIAAGLSGPRRPWSGSVRDFVLGTRVISGLGTHLRFGGEVMKNVAGYDLSRLMVGSYGCLGVLTEVSLKVLAAHQRLGGEPLDSAYWSDLNEQRLDFFNEGLPLWRLSLPNNLGPLDLPGEQLIDWGGAQRWLKSAANNIQSRALELGGHATCFSHGVTETPFQPLAPALLRYHRQLKAQLDPQGLFNPGRMYAEL